MASNLRALAVILYGAAALFAQNYPTAQISNGATKAIFYLPDAENGSYRGTRFDWSGIVQSLVYKGHSYFGQWYAHHDPLIHDAITGPVDVFDGPSSSYPSAAPGQTFLRIGVGQLEKPDEPRFQDTHTYKIIDAGKRELRKGANWIEFAHAVASGNGYGYVYYKRIELARGQAEMVISHTLRNTGTKTIETNVYNHGFLQIDEEPAGPNLSWQFPFEPKTDQDFGGMAKIEGQRIAYVREIKDGERCLAPLRGFSDSASDNQYVLENKRTGAGVRISVNRPVTKLTFWSRRMAYSPEATIHLSIAPGATEKWQITYEFYTIAEGVRE
jgi:hypothetical protein